MTVMDVVGPAIGASVFVLGMSIVSEPTRRTLNAVIVAGASGVYLSSGFGIWELAYPVLVTPVVYRALQSYRYIGVAWLMHAAWDDGDTRLWVTFDEDGTVLRVFTRPVMPILLCRWLGL